jgi:hypothetical protein
MQWLWYVGPIAVAVIFVLTGMWPERRRSYEVQRWKASFGPEPEPPKKEKRGAKVEPTSGVKEVNSMPGELMRMVDEAGGGAALAYYEIYAKLAYLAVMAADATNASDHQTLVAKLAKPGPTFTVRPLPIVEGSRIANTGVQFKKDPEFMELFLVEGADAKAIGKWLTRSMRDALREYPDLWLRVRGRVMAVTLYGQADAEQIDDLMVIADEIFAEVGAEGAPSLLGADDEEDDRDEDREDDEDDEDDEDEDGEDDEDEPEEKVATKPATQPKTSSAKPQAEPAKPKAATAKSTEAPKTKPGGPAKPSGAVTSKASGTAKSSSKPAQGSSKPSGK